MTQQQLMMSEPKIEEVPYGRIDTAGSATSPWSAMHYTDTCFDRDEKVDIYINDKYNIISHNFDSQYERYGITANIPSLCELSRDMGNM